MELEALLFQIKQTVSSISNNNKKQNNIDINTFIRDFSVPLASVISSTSPSSSTTAEQLKNKIIYDIFGCEIKKLASFSSSSSSVPDLCDNLLQTPCFVKVWNCIQFISALCYHIEAESRQTFRESCSYPSAKNNKEEEETIEDECYRIFLINYFFSCSSSSDVTIDEQRETKIRKIVAYAVTQITKDIVGMLSSQNNTSNNTQEDNIQLLSKYLSYQQSNMVSSEGKTLKSQLEQISQKIILCRNNDKNNSSSSSLVLQHLVKLRMLIVDCFGLFSGFRKVLVSKIRREFHASSNPIMSIFTSSLRGADLAEEVFDKIETTQVLLQFLLPSTGRPTREFVLQLSDTKNQKSNHNDHQAQSTEEKSSSVFCLKPVFYGPSEFTLIKTIKKVAFLGPCDSILDFDQDAVQKAMTDLMLRDKEKGIDKSILLPDDDDDESRNNSIIPWKMIQIAGEEACGNILQRRVQPLLAASLEKLRQERGIVTSLVLNDDDNDEKSNSTPKLIGDLSSQASASSSASSSCLLPWLRFVQCDACCMEQLMSASKSTSSSVHQNREGTTTTKVCPNRRCSANHTLAAGAVTEAIRAVFSMPRFETFVTFCLLAEFDELMRKSYRTISSNSFLLSCYRILQALTTLPSHYNSNNASSSSSSSMKRGAAASSSSHDNHPIEGTKKSWPLFFHQLSYQRIVDYFSNNGEQQEQKETEAAFKREEQCAIMLQDLCDADTQFYPRKYRGMIRGVLAGMKISNLKETESPPSTSTSTTAASMILIPRHFAPSATCYSQLQQDFSTSFSLRWPLQSLQDDFVKKIFAATSSSSASSSSSLRLTWLPNDGSCVARIHKKFIFRGSPLQIAVLFSIGEKSGSTCSDIVNKVFSGDDDEQESASHRKNLVQSTVDDLMLKTKLIEIDKQDGTYKISDDDSHVENHNLHRQNNNNDIVSSSSNLRHSSLLTLNQKINHIAQEIQNAKTRTSSRNIQQQQQGDADLQSLAERTRSKSADRSGGGGATASSSSSLISPIVIRCQALRLIKRCGKISFKQWIEATRQLIKYNLPENTFIEVVDKLVEGEFCSKNDENDGEYYEYLP